MTPNTLAQQIYAAVSAAFLCDARSLLDEERPLPLLLPPIPAILLERATSKESIVTELLTLRIELEPFRRYFTQLQEDRRRATSIAELRKVREALQALFKAVSMKYASVQPANLATAIGITGDAVRAAMSPGKVDSYLPLLKQGAEFLQQWWSSRPLFRLTSITDRLETLPSYAALANLLVGRNLSADEVRQFGQRYRPSPNLVN